MRRYRFVIAILIGFMWIFTACIPPTAPPGGYKRTSDKQKKSKPVQQEEDSDDGYYVSADEASSETEDAVSEDYNDHHKYDNDSDTRPLTKSPDNLKVYYGKAVYISNDLHGRPTASGERYDRNKLTAAHPFLPFGTICRVTNIANGRSVEVRINDRCKAMNGRIIDVSYKAAQQLDAVLAGVVRVKMEILKEVVYYD